MNMNDVARKVASMEGKEKQVDIAQIKEIIKCTMLVLAKYEDKEIIKKINWYVNKYDTVTGEPRKTFINKIKSTIGL